MFGGTNASDRDNPSDLLRCLTKSHARQMVAIREAKRAALKDSVR